jgi:UDP-N-acetylmuramoyl-tripeptide--D-alanyl-D-alanine ligase
MKPKRIEYLEKILRLMAVVVLFRHKPKIVGITGSLGKTSTKAAVFSVLSSKFYTRENLKNYNNEIGIPLTIIGAHSGGKNIFKWFWVFLKWIFVVLFPKYPKILVLELGVDRPGDMSYLMTFVKPTVGIVTNVSLSHVEFFNTVENIAKEKRVFVESLDQDGIAILNADDENVLKMGQHTLAQILSFGQSENAEVNASNVVYNYKENRPAGISFKLNYEGKNIPIRLSNILAAHYVYPALAAVAVGIVFKINLVDIAKALDDFRSPPGRMNLIKGINGSFIVDDTYNASPDSVDAAIKVLDELKAARKIAVIGDMLELGDKTEIEHREVGKKILSSKIDIFIAVGRRMKSAASELIASGYPAARIFQYDNYEMANKKLTELIQDKDLVLVKGSQGMRMEKIVEEIISEDQDAEMLLCRQSSDWKRKSFEQP